MFTEARVLSPTKPHRHGMAYGRDRSVYAAETTKVTATHFPLHKQSKYDVALTVTVLTWKRAPAAARITTQKQFN